MTEIADEGRAATGDRDDLESVWSATGDAGGSSNPT